MDDLVERLNQLRLDRAEATREHNRVVEESQARERDLLHEISLRRLAAAAARQNHTHSFQIGHRVRITNTLRNEYNVEGIITRVTRRMIQLRNDQGKSYSRAHWNVERVREPRHAQ